MKTTRNPRALSCRQIIALADAVVRKHGLKRVEHAAVRRMYDARMPMPLITRCVDGELWVDKYYVAYRLDDYVTRYAYLTHYHIREEMDSYAEASMARGEVKEIPLDIHKAFQRAYRLMERNGKNIWISSEFAGVDKSRLSHAQ